VKNNRRNTGSVLMQWAQARSAIPPDFHTRLDDLAARLDQLEQVVEATATEVQRVTEAEQFTAQLLRGHSVERRLEPSLSGPAV
jgi:hypothetical protein